MRLTRKEERYIKKREIDVPVSDLSGVENRIKNAVLEWQRKREYARDRARREEMQKEEMERRRRREEIDRFMRKQRRSY
jgi:hypothetical protein